MPLLSLTTSLTSALTSACFALVFPVPFLGDVPQQQFPPLPPLNPSAALPDLDPSLEVVYVLACEPDGTPRTQPPSQLLAALGRTGARLPDWVLVDSAQVGARVKREEASVMVRWGVRR